MACLDNKLKILVKEIQDAVVNYLKTEYRKDSPDCFFCEITKVEYEIWEGDLSDVSLDVSVRYGYWAGDNDDSNFDETATFRYLDTDWTADFIHGFVTANLYLEQRQKSCSNKLKIS